MTPVYPGFRIWLRRSAILVLCCGATGWAEQAPSSELPQWDTHNGVPITQQIRQQQIEAELAELGDRHPWAGDYAFGDGLGVNQRLLIAPEHGFVVTWHGCMGLYGANEGHVSETADGHLKLHFLWANRPGGFGGFPDELVPVPWGEAKMLIPPDSLIEFISAIHFLGESAAQGMQFKQTATKAKVSGRPQLPEPVASQLRSQAVTLTVSAVGALTTRQLRWGACLVQRDLWFDPDQAAQLADGLELWVKGDRRADQITLAPADRQGRVAKWEAFADEDCKVEPARLPEAGWVYTTGAFNPDMPQSPGADGDD